MGAFIVESLSVRASGSVRDHEVPSRPPLILARTERRALSESPRLLAPPFVFTPDWCASSPPALSPSPLGVSGLSSVCARSSAPFVWIHPFTHTFEGGAIKQGCDERCHAQHVFGLPHWPRLIAQRPRSSAHLASPPEGQKRRLCEHLAELAFEWKTKTKDEGGDAFGAAGEAIGLVQLASEES